LRYFRFIDNKCATTHIIHPMALMTLHSWPCPSTITQYVVHNEKPKLGTLLNLIPVHLAPRNLNGANLPPTMMRNKRFELV
jgi:hypothetical protein